MNILCRVYAILLFLVPSLANSQETYQKPPKEIQEILDAKLPPGLYLNPVRDSLLLLDRVRYPAIAVLAEPVLKLAGIRVNTLTNAKSDYPTYAKAISIKALPDGEIRPIAIPGAERLGGPTWNAPGTNFIFFNETSKGTELWAGNAKAATAHKIPGLKVNSLLSYSARALPDHETFLVKLIPQSRGAAPIAPRVPPGPRIQEGNGVKVASSTYEVRDVLRTQQDAKLFEYYTTSQLALVNIRTNAVTRIGKPGIYTKVLPSPDGKFILVERLHKPFSYQRAWFRFPRLIEVWSRSGKLVETIADLPIAEAVPIRGVTVGPRDFQWNPNKAAALVWVEALDGGDPKVKAEFRDKILTKNLNEPPKELARLTERFESMDFVEGTDFAFVEDNDPEKHWTRRFLYDLGSPDSKPRLVDSLSEDDHYGDPGNFEFHAMPSEQMAILREGDWVFRRGVGSSPVGDRPFLDRLNLKTLATERLFRSEADFYEKVLGVIDPLKGIFLTQRESPQDPPNVFWRSLEAKALENAAKGESERKSTLRQLTKFPDPMPQIRSIEKRLVNYQRSDGIGLSFTLYLPPGYKAGTKLPTVLHAYPLDFADKGVAGQVTGSTKMFTMLEGTSPLFFLLQGYAVLDEVAMPVVGPSASIYDTFIEQLNMNAKAAIDKAVELGVTDRERVGIIGHSHGALMTADLLAYSDLFRAGIARSGAYNKTLTMFGFQNEKRTLFEAKEVYFKVSPALQAEKIKRPLLLIHGELDSNPGTIPFQSEKMFEALRGSGGTTRLVMLPFENHGYLAKESVEHVLYEMMAWFNRYVKSPAGAQSL